MIAILVDSQSLGGIETHILQLSLGLSQANKTNEVWFYKKYKTAHPLEQQLIDNNINYIYLGGSFFSLLASLAARNIQLIHSHGYKANILARLAKIIFKIPVVSTFHNGDLGRGLLKLYTSIDLITSRLSVNIAVNDEIGIRLKQNCTIINNFVNTDNLAISSGKEIAFVGRVSHEKGPDTFIKLATMHQEVHFTIYGSGPMLAQLENTKYNNLTFAGEQLAMDKNWQNIGLLCITSRQEGLPMVALEAMARGIPILSFAVGGMPSLIIHERNGWLVVDNDIQTMSKYVSLWLQQSNDDKTTMQLKCRQTINNNYSIAKVIPQIIKLYEPLITKK